MATDFVVGEDEDDGDDDDEIEEETSSPVNPDYSDLGEDRHVWGN